ncbi:MAG: phosphoribosylaminoimidazolesuccinocarboxamide synthase [Candidatus Competibacteraceae bacterium]|nr:phosphoribosylaminoimidazolesuccinocarboxamide synthase [Candidatus Competibacteraceae bacterium]
MNDVLFQSAIKSLPLRHRGKVRDVYEVDAEHLLIVASDRLSAFDVVLPTPIPGKGRVLTAVSNFWFQRFDFIPNHLQLARKTLAEALPDPAERAPVEGRAVVARKLRALPVEAIVRGYLIGSGWKDYQRSGALCGLALPAGLRLADKLPEPIFTPSTKAAVGAHDENVSFEQVSQLIGQAHAEQMRAASIRIYREAAAYALKRGLIIADTKFEFGVDENDQLVLIDELLTPDSSRFWPLDGYQPGVNPPSFDKQFVRDYLETLDWDKTAPGPVLPDTILQQTAALYLEAQQRLTASNQADY